tara:strand:+ start:623 stop:766 length:144 start_codon:yes stop_codon:yes gene_type:complete
MNKMFNIIFSVANYKWQNFIEDMFGMGNFSCPSYEKEIRKRSQKEKN